MRALDIANKKAKTRFDKEHVTPFIRSSNKFEKINLFNNYDHSNLRWTLDEELDFKLIGKIFNHFSPSIHFSYQNILNLKKENPEIFKINNKISRNEGLTLDNGPKLYKEQKFDGRNNVAQRIKLLLTNGHPITVKKGM